MVIPEVKLSKVTVQVLLGAVLVDALHAALEDAEVAFNRVRVRFTATVFAVLVANDLMVSELATNLDVVAGFVRHQTGFLGDVGAHDGGGDWAGRYYQMAEDGASVPCDDMYGRDGMFEKTDMFLIFERDDLARLRDVVDEALKLPDLPKAAKVFERID